MKSNPTDRMKDPFYAGLMFQIENIICQADADAAGRGLRLTDSQVRSALVKTRKKLNGESPEIPVTNEREKLLASLIDSLVQAPAFLMEQRTGEDGRPEEQPLRKSDWIAALETVAHSVRTRSHDIPGSRGYLDFVQELVQQAKRGH